MRYPAHGTTAYRLLGAIVWRPYHWLKLRQEPELRPFMIRRRIWGGERITPERRMKLRRLRAELSDAFEVEA